MRRSTSRAERGSWRRPWPRGIPLCTSSRAISRRSPWPRPARPPRPRRRRSRARRTRRRVLGARPDASSSFIALKPPVPRRCGPRRRSGPAHVRRRRARAAPGRRAVDRDGTPPCSTGPPSSASSAPPARFARDRKFTVTVSTTGVTRSSLGAAGASRASRGAAARARVGRARPTSPSRPRAGRGGRARHGVDSRTLDEEVDDPCVCAPSRPLSPSSLPCSSAPRPPGRTSASTPLDETVSTPALADCSSITATGPASTPACTHRPMRIRHHPGIPAPAHRAGRRRGMRHDDAGHDQSRRRGRHGRVARRVDHRTVLGVELDVTTAGRTGDSVHRFVDHAASQRARPQPRGALGVGRAAATVSGTVTTFLATCRIAPASVRIHVR